MTDIFTDVAAPDAELLVSVDDLAEWLGVTPDTPWSNRAETALQIATAYIRTTTERYLSVVTDETVTLDGQTGRAFLLPEWPVTDVQSVSELGELVDPAAYDWSEIGRVRRLSGYWTGRQRGLVVVYSHGGGADLAAAQGVCLRMAARTLGSPDGREIQSQTLGAASVTYAAGSSASGGLADDERIILERLGRR